MPDGHVDGRVDRIVSRLESERSVEPHRLLCWQKNTMRRPLSMEVLEPRLALSGDPLISEFLARPNNSLTDEDGDSPDWIEIHNPGDQVVDLEGWYLTDDARVLTKWQLPSVRINAGGHLLVFASDKNRATPGCSCTPTSGCRAKANFCAVKPDGVTIASQFDVYPPQFTDVSYGVTQAELVTPLVAPGATAHYLIPDAEDDARMGRTWTGADASFDDSPAAGWSTDITGIGFDAQSPPNSVQGTVAQDISAYTPGNQFFAGSLGTDFVVNQPIRITALGAFDDGSDGLKRAITVQLWQRDPAATPQQPQDDTGQRILLTETFTPQDPGQLVGGNRFKTVSEPLPLSPGHYTLVSQGYGATERNGNSGGDGAFGVMTSSPSISFESAARFGTDGTLGFPTFIDAGQAGRYGAGTFAFLETASADPAGDTPPGISVAYRTRPGVGNAMFAGNLGMDFEVLKPIRVTAPGAFDSGQDGIAGMVAVSLWSLTGQAGTRLADRTFTGQEGTLQAGTGSRFIPLDESVVLRPGFYSIVASGFLGSDLYSRADFANPLHGQLDSGDGAIRFVGTSRSSYFGSEDRFLERSHHRLPERLDHGPVNKWAAGSFQFETVMDELVATDIRESMHRANATVYARLPFQVEDPSAWDGLRLKIRFDDGFVAYINGTEVARRNAPAALAWDSRSQGNGQDANLSESASIDLTPHLGLLCAGLNVLAIQGLNWRADDTDFLLLPQLEAIRLAPPVPRFYTPPTPKAPNQQGYDGVVQDAQVSVGRGIISQQQLNAAGQLPVEISSPTAGAEVYYTVDGTEPAPDTAIRYTGPLLLDGTTVVRSKAFLDGHIPSQLDTQTYLFLEDVLQQAGVPADLPPHWNGVPADYALSQDPVDLARLAGDADLSESQYQQIIVDSLRSLPSLSLVLDPGDLFGPVDGLYANPYVREMDSERPVSVEYLLPDGGAGFQIDAGLRLMGWTSRVPAVSPKHSLRIAFRGEYGEGRLDFPFFDDTWVDSFNTIALRANSRDAWISDYPFGQDVRCIRWADLARQPPTFATNGLEPCSGTWDAPPSPARTCTCI